MERMNMRNILSAQLCNIFLQNLDPKQYTIRENLAYGPNSLPSMPLQSLGQGEPGGAPPPSEGVARPREVLTCSKHNISEVSNLQVP